MDSPYGLSWDSWDFSDRRLWVFRIDYAQRCGKNPLSIQPTAPYPIRVLSNFIKQLQDPGPAQALSGREVFDRPRFNWYRISNAQILQERWALDIAAPYSISELDSGHVCLSRGLAQLPIPILMPSGIIAFGVDDWVTNLAKLA